MAYEYQEYPKFLYHPELAPEGKIFKGAEETKGLSRQGWVDSPAKFPKPGTFGLSAKRWWVDWEWSFTAIAKILGAIGAVLAILEGARSILMGNENTEAA